MKEVGTFIDECALKITSGGIFYKRTSSTAVMKQKPNSTKNKVVAVNVINTSMYNDRCCIAPNFCSDDCNTACHVKLVICNERIMYISKELFLIAGTNKTSRMIYETCNNLVMLHPLSGDVDYKFHAIEQGANNVLKTMAKNSKKEIQHIAFETLPLFQELYKCSSKKTDTCAAFNNSTQAMKTKLSQWENYLTEVVQLPKKKTNTINNYYPKSRTV